MQTECCSAVTREGAIGTKKKGGGGEEGVVCNDGSAGQLLNSLANHS